MKHKRKSINLETLLRILFIVCLVFSGPVSLFAQQNITVTGVVTDELGETMPGVSIVVKGSTKGIATDLDGSFKIEVKTNDALVVSFLGYETLTVAVEGRQKIDIQLKPSTNELDEVTVVAFAKQKKASVIASVTTIKPSELRVPASNLTTAFAGRVAGLISYQRSGEPGVDNAEFFVRGVTTFGTGKNNPLILIDGVEMTSDDLSRLTVDDIASFSIMKDANATALYGARGANGVILVTSKEGREGKVKISFRAEGSYSEPTEKIKYADPVTYMRLHNEAIRTRNPMASVMYSPEKIYNTERGIDPVRYPAVDWQKMLFKDNTFNHRYNMNISGGGQIARYFISASYARDNGILQEDKYNNFNTNIQNDRYVLRSNININLSKTTEAVVRLHGAFDDYTGPLDGGTDLYKKAMNANPVLFRPYYEKDEANQSTRHILFGNYETGQHLNPYAAMLKGFKTSDRSDMLAQFELKQELDFITKGLAVRGLFNVNRYSLLDLYQSYSPFMYALANTDDPSEYKLKELNPTSGTESLELTGNWKDQTNTMYFEGAAMYNRTFAEKHDVSGLLVYTLREQINGNPKNLQASLPRRNLGLAGRLTYAYDSRYFIEGNFGYNGSERFAKNERFGFFPSIGGGWIVTNESFMQPFSDVLSKLKLKATYGLVGNDEIGNVEERFFYLSQVNLYDQGKIFYTGYDYNSSPGAGISISRYEDPLITWEISRKMNLGLELNLWNSLELQVDYFTEKRSNILQSRTYIPSTMGLQATPYSNVGKASGQGMEITVDYNKSFTKDFWTAFRGTFTYATSKFDKYEEPDYSTVPWRSRQGQKISQQWGFVAERLFLDDEEVKNSPTQFGNYGAGDIKYKDIDGNGVINDNDMVPIGYPTTPEIVYGFGFSAGYKNFDISCFFQGSARSSFWIDQTATAPFVNRSNEKVDELLHPYTTNRALLQYWADDHWSESNRNIYALWPRLSPTAVINNNYRSTWFMRDGSFLRFKTAELGYTLPNRWTNRIQLEKARLYLSGNNLFLLSVFKMWDVEKAGNAVAYPLQRVFNIGITVDF